MDEIEAVDIDLLTEIDNEEEEEEEFIQEEVNKFKRTVSFDKIKFYLILIIVVFLTNLPVFNNILSVLSAPIQIIIKISLTLILVIFFEKLLC